MRPPSAEPVLPRLNAPDPCAACANYDLCADRLLACKRYAQFVDETPETGSRYPDHKTYLEIFDKAALQALEEAERRETAERAREQRRVEQERRERARRAAIPKPPMFTRKRPDAEPTPFQKMAALAQLCLRTPKPVKEAT